MEAIQQQSFPITEARLISAAAPPTHKSGPLTLTVLGIRRLRWRTCSVSARRFCARPLTRFSEPLVRSKLDSMSIVSRCCLDWALARSARVLACCTFCQSRLRQLNNDIEYAGVPRTSNLIKSMLGREASNEMNALDFQGAPKEAESRRRRIPARGRRRSTLRLCRGVSVDQDRGRHQRIKQDQKVIRITSSLPGEGKSTVASNLAQLIAHSGKRVILLDGDLRNPTLTRALKANSKSSLLEVLDNSVTLKEVVFRDDQTGLSFVQRVRNHSWSTPTRFWRRIRSGISSTAYGTLTTMLLLIFSARTSGRRPGHDQGHRFICLRRRMGEDTQEFCTATTIKCS